MEIDKLKRKIVNNGFQVKIRLKKLQNGTHSVILDYHYNENGKERRERKALNIYLTGLKKYYNDEKNKLEEAHLIRNKYEELVRKKKSDIFDEVKTIYLYDWLERFQQKQTNRNSMKIWRNTIRHIKLFQKKDIPLKDVSKTFCENFAYYLKHDAGINQNSAHTYYTRLKIAIKRAYEDNLLSRNYASEFVIKKVETRREYLTIDELTKLKETPYINERVKRAFLFSCFTGLRLGDIINLKFSQIITENGNSFIVFHDEKTKEFNKINMHPFAVEILMIEKKDHDSDNVFIIPCESTIRYHIKRLVEKAGIHKHITPHCGRHTFATLMISYDIDLYTVSKYLGHNDVKVTQIYAKLIDKKKNEAIFKIPKI
jgi:integrase